MQIRSYANVSVLQILGVGFTVARGGEGRGGEGEEQQGRA